MKDEIEVMYAQYEGLIVKLATGNQNLFVDVLGKEDAIQEAGLAFVIAYRQYEQYGEAVLGNQQALPGFFRSAILNHLKNAIKKELAYQNRQPEYLDETSYDVIPDLDLDVELQVLHNENMNRDELRLRILRTILQHPQLLVDKVGLTMKESLVVWKLYVDGLSERKAANRLEMFRNQLCRHRDMALYKMRKYIISKE